MKTLKRTWAEVSLDNLEHNYRAIKNHIPEGCRFLGVMKADAYGHGAVPLSHALCELGAEYLAVSNLEEAIQLRRGGVRAPMLILGYTPASFADTMVFMDITQEVHSLEYAKELDTALAGTNYILNVHLKLDTGMTRIGFFAYDHERTLPELLEVCGLPHLHVEGVFTHFCVADSKAPEDEAFTRTQYARFTAMLDALAAHGIRPELRHCASSGATILYPELALDMVRPGSAAADDGAHDGRAAARDPGGNFDQLRTHLYGGKRYAGGRAAHRLCRRAFARPLREGELPHPGKDGALGGPYLHGYVHGGRVGDPGDPGGRRSGAVRL